MRGRFVATVKSSIASATPACEDHPGFLARGTIGCYFENRRLIGSPAFGRRVGSIENVGRLIYGLKGAVSFPYKWLLSRLGSIRTPVIPRRRPLPSQAKITGNAKPLLYNCTLRRPLRGDRLTSSTATSGNSAHPGALHRPLLYPCLSFCGEHYGPDSKIGDGLGSGGCHRSGSERGQRLAWPAKHPQKGASWQGTVLSTLLGILYLLVSRPPPVKDSLPNSPSKACPPAMATAPSSSLPPPSATRPSTMTASQTPSPVHNPADLYHHSEVTAHALITNTLQTLDQVCSLQLSLSQHELSCFFRRGHPPVCRKFSPPSLRKATETVICCLHCSMPRPQKTTYVFSFVFFAA